MAFDPEYIDEDLVDPDFKGDKSILSWILDVLTKASKVRRNFVIRQIQLADEFASKMKMDSVSGELTENTELYCAAHANLVFLLNQTIESFHGALTASDYLIRNPSDYRVVRLILLDPRTHKGGIKSTLQRDSLSAKMRSNLCSLPRLDGFEEPDRSELIRMFDPCFERFELCTKYSVFLRDMLKNVRNVYAHNFRFVFFDISVPESKPLFDETSLGFLSEGANDEMQDDASISEEIRVHDVLRDIFYVGAKQRWATVKMTTRLVMFERWIFQNMRNCLWNNDTPVLPREVPYLAPDDSDRYNEIRESQGYDFVIPKRAAYGRYDMKEQEEVYHEFLRKLQDLGEPTKVKDQMNREITLDFKEWRQSE